MNNDMGCSVMMFGRASKYAITYKTSTSGFRVYKRKYLHNFKVPIDGRNYEGSYGANLGEMQAYAIASGNEIQILSVTNFELL